LNRFETSAKARHRLQMLTQYHSYLNIDRINLASSSTFSTENFKEGYTYTNGYASFFKVLVVML